jgi:CHAT domain-containing protein
LADDEALTVADILAARSVPTRAVLLACESGRSPAQASAALGIGEAFIARGAAEVLAAETRLSDASAQIFSRLFYSAKGGLAQRARTAQLGLLAAGHDWRAYRVLVR